MEECLQTSDEPTEMNIQHQHTSPPFQTGTCVVDIGRLGYDYLESIRQHVIEPRRGQMHAAELEVATWASTELYASTLTRMVHSLSSEEHCIVLESIEDCLQDTRAKGCLATLVHFDRYDDLLLVCKEHLIKMYLHIAPQIVHYAKYRGLHWYYCTLHHPGMDYLVIQVFAASTEEYP